MQEEGLAKVPLLVYANKQDLEFALEADKVLETLNLSDISDRTWNIQACSAMTKEGQYTIIKNNEQIFKLFFVLQACKKAWNGQLRPSATNEKRPSYSFKRVAFEKCAPRSYI